MPDFKAAVEELEPWRANLISGKGGVKPVLANCITVLENHDKWAGVLEYNEFSLNVEARALPPPWVAAPVGRWTDHCDRMATDWLQREECILAGVETVGVAIQTVAQKRPHHPVRDYLGSLKWDGEPRIDTWLTAYLGAEASNLVAAVGARWLISAVARIYRPGCKVDTCLILEGPQGRGKSTALKILGGEWFTDDLADLGSKDAAMQSMGAWIIEIAELDAMTRAESSKIKAFMSRSTDRFRPPYGKNLLVAPRQCVFAGTVNHDTYLKDETGGRRFWPVRCGVLDLEGLRSVRDQIWAEAVARFRDGAAWWLDSQALQDEAAEQVQARFDADVWQTVISDWASTWLKDDLSIDEILLECLKKDKDKWIHADKVRIARCLRAMGYERFYARTGNSREWRYRKGEE